MRSHCTYFLFFTTYFCAHTYNYSSEEINTQKKIGFQTDPSKKYDQYIHYKLNKKPTDPINEKLEKRGKKIIFNPTSDSDDSKFISLEQYANSNEVLQSFNKRMQLLTTENYGNSLKIKEFADWYTDEELAKEIKYVPIIKNGETITQQTNVKQIRKKNTRSGYRFPIADLAHENDIFFEKPEVRAAVFKEQTWSDWITRQLKKGFAMLIGSNVRSLSSSFRDTHTKQEWYTFVQSILQKGYTDTEITEKERDLIISSATDSKNPHFESARDLIYALNEYQRIESIIKNIKSPGYKPKDAYEEALISKINANEKKYKTMFDESNQFTTNIHEWDLTPKTQKISIEMFQKKLRELDPEAFKQKLKTNSENIIKETLDIIKKTLADFSQKN